MQALHRPSTLTTSSARPSDTTCRPTLQFNPTSGFVPRRPPACPTRQGAQQSWSPSTCRCQFSSYQSTRNWDSSKEAGLADAVWADASARSTACCRCKVQREQEKGKWVKLYDPLLSRSIFRKCRQLKTAPEHRHHYGNWFCHATSKETGSEWEERMKSMWYTSMKRKHFQDPKVKPLETKNHKNYPPKKYLKKPKTKNFLMLPSCSSDLYFLFFKMLVIIVHCILI